MNVPGLRTCFKDSNNESLLEQGATGALFRGMRALIQLFDSLSHFHECFPYLALSYAQPVGQLQGRSKT